MSKMMRIRRLALLALGLVLVAAAPLWAASGPELLQKGVEHYEYAEFEQAARTLQQALAAPGLTPALRAKANAYLGLVELVQGREQGALKFFSAAKAADPGFKPDQRRFPPRAQKLFQQATAAPPAAAPPPKPKEPKAKKARAKKPTRPMRGYVVDVSGEEVVLDMGRRQGVKAGDRFEAFVVKTLRHPVTHKRLVKRTRRGVVKVVEVEQDLASARVISGKGRIKPGQRIAKLSSPAKDKPTRRVKGRRLVVLPPLSGEDPAEGITARAAAKALNRIKGLPYRAVTLTPAQLKKIEKMGFDPQDYLFRPGLSLRSLSSFFSGKDKKKGIMDACLKPGEVALLKEIFQALGARAMLIWRLEYPPADDNAENKADLVCNLHLYGKDEPAVRKLVTISGEKLGPPLTAALARLTAKALK